MWRDSDEGVEEEADDPDGDEDSRIRIERGDLHISVEVVIPQFLNKNQREELKAAL